MSDSRVGYDEGKDLSEIEFVGLVNGARRGSQDDFTRICELKQRKLFFYCLNILGNHHDAEDSAQETILQMWKSIGDLKKPESFDAWMLTVARSKCIQILSKRKRQDELSIDANEGILENSVEFEDLDREVIPEKYAEDAELSETVYKAITELPTKRREALIMYYYEGLNTTEIAKITKSTPNAVTGVIAKARLQLKEKLQALDGKWGLFIMGITPEQSVIGKVLKDASFNHVSDSHLSSLEGVWHVAIAGVTPYAIMVKTYIKAFSAAAAAVVVLFTGIAIGANTDTVLAEEYIAPAPAPAVVEPAAPLAPVSTSGEIAFAGDCDCGHLNPNSAALEGSPAADEDVVWKITPKGADTVLTSGSGKDASSGIASLSGSSGDYTLIFTATGDDDSYVEFGRDFTVE
jgi:RNA polymerase sigma-70 factor (ECF subfamily)